MAYNDKKGTLDYLNKYIDELKQSIVICENKLKEEEKNYISLMNAYDDYASNPKIDSEILYIVLWSCKNILNNIKTEV